MLYKSIIDDDMNTFIECISNPKRKNDNPRRVRNNITFVHRAALYGRASMIPILIKHGANPTLADNKGLTPLIIGIQKGYKDVVKELLPYSDVNKEFKMDNFFVRLKHPYLLQ